MSDLTDQGREALDTSTLHHDTSKRDWCVASAQAAALLAIAEALEALTD